MKVFIYALKNPTTKAVRYVGLTRYPSKRLRDEIACPHTLHLRNWIGQLRATGFLPEMEILEEVEEKVASAVECKWIAIMKSWGCDLLNFTTGGEVGYGLSKDQRQAISARMKGIKRGPMPQWHKDKIRRANKGKVFSPNNGAITAERNRQRRGIPLPEAAKEKLRLIGKQIMVGERFRKWQEGNQHRPRSSKCTDQQKSEIKRLLLDGYSTKVIADFYRLSLGTIADVRRGSMWRNIVPADIVFNQPKYKHIQLIRNEKGQYGRVAARQG